MLNTSCIAKTVRVARVGALALLMVAALLPGTSYAHILNEKTQFPDIAAFDARFDIVLLVGAGVIPQTPVFEPERALSRADLAAWAALANGLGEGGETPEVDALAEAALDAGLVESLDGEATLAEINEALFDGAIAVDEPDRVLTRAAAASWIANHLTDPIGDTTLLARLGREEGPVGSVVLVESREVEGGGSRYFFTIGDTTLPMDGHGRVANGPSDLLQWEGRDVTRSFVTDDSAGAGELMLTFLQAAPETESQPSESNNGTNDLTGRLGQGPSAGATQDDAATGSPPYILYAVAAAVVILGIALFGRRGRKR